MTNDIRLTKLIDIFDNNYDIDKCSYKFLLLKPLSVLKYFKLSILNWIEKKMPQRTIRPEQNIVRIPISTIMNSKFDPKVLSKLDKLENEEKNKKKQETLEEFI